MFLPLSTKPCLFFPLPNYFYFLTWWTCHLPNDIPLEVTIENDIKRCDTGVMFVYVLVFTGNTLFFIENNNISQWRFCSFFSHSIVIFFSDKNVLRYQMYFYSRNLFLTLHWFLNSNVFRILIAYHILQ